MQYLERVTWNQYIRTIAKGHTNVEISKRTGIGPSTISRWGHPKATDVITFARAYNRPVAEALIAADYITAAEADAEVSYTVQKTEEISNARLVELITERLGVEMSHPLETITSPADYGQEPTPDDYDLAAGHITRPHDPHNDSA